MREEQWKYKRPRAAINRFPPRALSLGRIESEEEAVFSACRITESPAESIDFSSFLEALKLP